MSSEVAVVGGLLGITGLLAYFAFELRESSDDMNQRVAIFLAFISLIFLNVTMFIVYGIARDSGISYLNAPVILVALQALMWVSLVLVALFWFGLMFALIRWLLMVLKNFGRKMNTP